MSESWHIRPFTGFVFSVLPGIFFEWLRSYAKGVDRKILAKEVKGRVRLGSSRDGSRERGEEAPRCVFLARITMAPVVFEEQWLTSSLGSSGSNLSSGDSGPRHLRGAMDSGVALGQWSSSPQWTVVLFVTVDSGPRLHEEMVLHIERVSNSLYFKDLVEVYFILWVDIRAYWSDVRDGDQYQSRGVKSRTSATQWTLCAYV